MYKIALLPASDHPLLIACSIKTNEQEAYIAKPQNEARSDIQLPEEGKSAAISSYRYISQLIGIDLLLNTKSTSVSSPA